MKKGEGAWGNAERSVERDHFRRVEEGTAESSQAVGGDELVCPFKLGRGGDARVKKGEGVVDLGAGSFPRQPIGQGCSHFESEGVIEEGEGLERSRGGGAARLGKRGIRTIEITQEIDARGA